MKHFTIETLPARRLILLLCLFNLILKLALLPTNRAEYTDGILQLTLFSHSNKLYPPLFTIIALFLKPLFGNAEFAGRFVSAVASTALVLPIFFLARRLFDKRAAFFAGVVYTISPVALRWSIHAMTDALFALIFFLAAVEYLKALVTLDESSDKHLVWATFLVVLATLTRYQGVLLFPPIVFLIIIVCVRRRTIPVKIVAVQVLWALPILWMVFYGFRHPAQFAERAGASGWQTILNILNLFESFLAYSPYFLTLPVCFAFIAGLFYLGWGERNRWIFAALFGYLLIALLLLQSAFSSFQSRYLLLLIPFTSIFAGWGMAALKERWRVRPLLFSVFFTVTVLYGMGFGLTSIFLQRETFSDLKDAALFLRSLPEDAPIYSNEAYKDLGPVKMRYWSGRDVRPYEGRQKLPAGAVLCLTSAYGGITAFEQYKIRRLPRYQPELLAAFGARIVPLLPDVMQEPGTHQNPLALTFRYTPQHFRTEIYLIRKDAP